MAATDTNTSDLSGGSAKKRSPSDLIEGFSSLNLLRQGGLMVGLAASVAIGFAIVLWSQGEEYRPLYSSLDRVDTREVVGILEQNGISYRVEPSSGVLLVSSRDIHTARLKLAEVGVPGQDTVGFELLDQEQPLGTSQFMESTRYHRSLEGELARTISSINSVRHTRVHLAIPKRSVFVREARDPTGSVFLDVFPGRTVEPAQVKAIINLVASSISELRPENVTVVDQRGNLLSDMGRDNEELTMATRQHDYARRVEDDLSRRVQRILEPVVGDGRYRAEVSADIDFTAIEQAAETFNPDLAAVRSEQTLNELRLGNDFLGGIPGALTNQPPGAAQAPEQIDPETGEPVAAQPQNRREQATRNYELDRTISYTRHQQGKINRVSVAVVVDDKRVRGPDGAEVREPWTENELERLAVLVRDAVGFSALRGDSVNVINSAFVARDDWAVEDLEVPWWQQDWIQGYIKQAAAVLVIAALIFGLLRPVMRSLASAGKSSSDDDEARELAALEAAGLDGYDGMSDETVTLTGGALALPGPEESYEQQLNAIKGLIADDPARVAQVVKSWVNRED
ncbi:flagellar basal-body MS-ring/collar protein FliF [Marinimicrobium alkaliphilum]|uniref:flagellar basal-body MS-ring/collar protein FliF n=1 Tax=Marinimicrobium alkaliphilum TaxID=2202654 RepID=UPI000DB9B88C|nr:flagellar basal-body MS-ring/collar protein FliF [Marinimicrobium alkaliphilum]